MSSDGHQGHGQRRIRLLDVVAVTADMPEHGLIRGHVGTVVELLGATDYEVEFSDDEGRTFAQVPLAAEPLMVLHFHRVKVV